MARHRKKKSRTRNQAQARSTALHRRVTKNIARKVKRKRGRNPEPGIPATSQDPSSEFPGGGEQPPAGCCIDTDLMQIICPDTTHPWHGASVSNVEKIHDNGLVSFTFLDPTTGMERGIRLPLCEMPEEGECCYDALQGVVLCDDPNDPRHNQPAELVEQSPEGWVYVCGALGGQDVSAIVCARMPLCPEQPPDGCCYDAINGAIVCPNGEFPHGLSPEIVKQGEDDNGKAYVVVIHPQLNNGNRTVLYLCPPPDCCFDAATGTLRCPSDESLDGLEVSLEHMTDVMADGRVFAAVSHPSLPGGVAVFPVCDDGVPDDCCYDGQQQVLVCPNNPDLNGTSAGVVTEFTGPDGKTWVSVAWPGGGARMPLCTEECPPSYCCVNLQTGLFICPADPDLNGQAADVADVITQNGFNIAVLSDGTQVPVCGSDCPPPELCPDCPPGMWMTPDKECVELPGDECPKCPPDGQCPPGYWKDPDGICRLPPECPECPKYPPGDCPKCLRWPPPPVDDFCPPNRGPEEWWGGSCCESCENGGSCDCEDGDSHPGMRHHAAGGGMVSNPSHAHCKQKAAAVAAMGGDPAAAYRRCMQNKTRGRGRRGASPRTTRGGWVNMGPSADCPKGQTKCKSGGKTYCCSGGCGSGLCRPAKVAPKQQSGARARQTGRRGVRSYPTTVAAMTALYKM